MKVISLDEVPRIELPNNSWSTVLVNQDRVAGNRSALGYSVFTPGTVTADLSHQAEELAYVVKGRGELRLPNRNVPFSAGDALYVPVGAWHVVANTGDEDVEMVFAFSHPDYPPTERR